MEDAMRTWIAAMALVMSAGIAVAQGWHEPARGTAERVLIDPSCYEGVSTDRVLAPTPLGRMGRKLQEIYEMPVERRPLDLYAELAELVTGEPVAGGDEARTQALIEAMRQLISDVALPATLQQANVPEDDLEMLAQDAMLQQRLLVNNPREVTYDDALAIYRAAYWG